MFTIIIVIIGIAIVYKFINGVYIGYTLHSDSELSALSEKEQTINALQDKITMLEIVIERRQESGYILECELEKCTTPQKKAALLNRINSLDKATFKDREKLHKLKKELEDLL